MLHTLISESDITSRKSVVNVQFSNFIDDCMLLWISLTFAGCLSVVCLTQNLHADRRLLLEDV